MLSTDVHKFSTQFMIFRKLLFFNMHHPPRKLQISFKIAAQ